MYKPHLAMDGYKVSHPAQYPEKTEYVYSNMTARSAAHANMPASFDNKVVVVGVQGFIKKHLIKAWNKGFFKRKKAVVLAEFQKTMDGYLGEGAVTSDQLGELHDLGYLPLTIKCVPEGSRVNIRVPFLTIVNTDPRFYWLTNRIETLLSAELWKMITVATISYEYRRILNKYVELTGSDKGFADWQLHDFSMRGLDGLDGAAKTGAAHLMAAGFGSDTVPAIDYLEKYYGATGLIAGSVPATEHSVSCCNIALIEQQYLAASRASQAIAKKGLGDNPDSKLVAERLFISKLTGTIYPSGIVSVVSDTYDFWSVLTLIVPSLKEEILKRTPNALGQAKVVFRPDSGDPVKIITGYKVLEIKHLSDWDAYDSIEGHDAIKFGEKYYKLDYETDNFSNAFESFNLNKEIPLHEVKGAVEVLWDIFGGTTTDKGFKTLHERVGLIYGDSITLARAELILQRLADKGFSAGNIVFGIGSYTYQYITRDTFGMAIKATWASVDGYPLELSKDPKTGDGVKKSAKGLLRVDKEGDNWVLTDQVSQFMASFGDLQIVFNNGDLFNETTLTRIRSLLEQ